MTYDSFVRLALVAGAVLSLAGAPPRRATAAAGPCLGPDRYSNGEIDFLTRRATSPDSEEASARRTFRIPTVSDTAIALVDDETLCRQALDAYTGELESDGAPPSAVYVVRVGSVFIVSNPDYLSDKFIPHLVLDRRMTRLSSFVR